MKNVVKLTFVVILCSLHFSCTEQFTSTELRDNFTAKQIEELKSITIFFQKEYCDDNNNNFEECFNNSLPSLLDNGWKTVLDKIDFNKQLILYSSLSEATFNEIWEFSKGSNNSKDPFKSILPKSNGKYLNFLKVVGQKNKLILEYYHDLIKSGDFESNGYLQQLIYSNQKSFDLSDPNIQLIISIHFLSQNDQQKRQ